MTTVNPGRGNPGYWPDETRHRLEAELATLRDRRRQLGAGDRGEPDVGDRADEADALELGDELGVLDDRIAAVSALLTDGPTAGTLDGTLATLRFDDGTVLAVRTVAITEEIPPGQEDTTTTTDSPLGLALAGRRAGDIISYQTPGGEMHARILSLEPPGAAR